MENGKTTPYDAFIADQLISDCNHHVPRIRRTLIIEVHLEEWFDSQKDGQGYANSIKPMSRKEVASKYFCSACNKRMEKDEGRVQ